MPTFHVGLYRINIIMSDSFEAESSDESVKTTPGIVYLSSVPPFMRPHKLRHLLSRYGAVGRVYLQPEGEYVPVLCPCHLFKTGLYYDAAGPHVASSVRNNVQFQHNVSALMLVSYYKPTFTLHSLFDPLIGVLCQFC